MVKSTNEKIISADFHAFLSKELSDFEKKSGIKLTNSFVKIGRASCRERV